MARTSVFLTQQSNCTYELTWNVTTSMGPRKFKADQFPAWKKKVDRKYPPCSDEELLAAYSCSKNESVLFKSATPSKSSMLQWKATQPSL